MNQSIETAGAYECQTCGGISAGPNRPTCCGGPMAVVETAETATADPTLDELLRTVFGMSDTELEICLCVMEAGELTVQELASQIGYDRSVVARHLNHLADLGVVDKRRRVRTAGGHVYVYIPQDPETVRTSLQREFLAWVGLARNRLEALEREKVESIAEPEDGDGQWQVFQEH